jgi:hypothetical protein
MIVLRLVSVLQQRLVSQSSRCSRRLGIVLDCRSLCRSSHASSLNEVRMRVVMVNSLERHMPPVSNSENVASGWCASARGVLSPQRGLVVEAD